MTITGTITYQNIGMGFYGIETDNGKQYQPLNLDSAFAKKGLRVKVIAKTLNVETMEMWGTPIEIQKIEKV
ncbi:MAG: hypothetical protein AB8G22_16115 [Saprospiraceae bacterium]